MKIELENEEVLTGGGSVKQVAKFHVSQNNALLMSYLRDRLYTNKPLAVLREYITNAIDAHVEAGCPEKAIDIYLPTHLHPMLVVRDYGLGMSEDVIQTVFAAYGESLKRKDNSQMGGLGIGGKAGFCMADHFTITSYQAGKKKIYTAFLDETKQGQINLVNEEGTEETGIEISIPIPERLFPTMRAEAVRLTRFFTVPYNLHGADVEKEELTAPGKMLRHTQETYAVVGQVPYLFDGQVVPAWNSFRKKNKETIGAVLLLGVGDVNVALNRESLEMTEKTIASLNAAVEALLRSAKEQWESLKDSRKTAFQQYISFTRFMETQGFWFGDKGPDELVLKSADLHEFISKKLNYEPYLRLQIGERYGSNLRVGIPGSRGDVLRNILIRDRNTARKDWTAKEVEIDIGDGAVKTFSVSPNDHHRDGQLTIYFSFSHPDGAKLRSNPNLVNLRKETMLSIGAKIRDAVVEYATTTDQAWAGTPILLLSEFTTIDKTEDETDGLVRNVPVSNYYRSRKYYTWASYTEQRNNGKHFTDVCWVPARKKECNADPLGIWFYETEKALERHSCPDEMRALVDLHRLVTHFDPSTPELGTLYLLKTTSKGVNKARNGISVTDKINELIQKAEQLPGFTEYFEHQELLRSAKVLPLSLGKSLYGLLPPEHPISKYYTLYEKGIQFSQNIKNMDPLMIEVVDLIIKVWESGDRLRTSKDGARYEQELLDRYPMLWEIPRQKLVGLTEDPALKKKVLDYILGIDFYILGIDFINPMIEATNVEQTEHQLDRIEDGDHDNRGREDLRSGEGEPELLGDSPDVDGRRAGEGPGAGESEEADPELEPRTLHDHENDREVRGPSPSGLVREEGPRDYP